VFRKKPLAAAITALSAPAVFTLVVPAAQAQTGVVEEIIVNATRRTATVQDVPINITAFSGENIREQGIKNLRELGSWVPGIHIVDQGARAADRIVARGLNADPLGSSEGLLNTGGGTVATYVGDIPLYVDLMLNDLERVEVLLGPQGTLYGAGTMGGAIRYIPRKPDVEAFDLEVRGDVYTYDSEGDDAGTDVGGTINIPMGDTFALRANLDYVNNPGFIDYNYLVREVGVSNPDPDFTDSDDVSANIKSKEDANDEETLSGRIALRWTPNDVVDANLSYYYQKIESGGRTINHKDALNTGDYESGMRVLEPNDRTNQLIALEVIADLGFAELTSATGYSEYEEEGQRDQTDLLIGLEYSYEAFPRFSAFTAEDVDEETFTQEIRLVSTADGRYNWIVGGFYNDYEKDDESSKEFTPNYDLFAVAEFGGIQPRPDSLEYYSIDIEDREEMALFGEFGFQITDRWQVTLGARYYKYDLDTSSAVDFPLLRTVFFGDDPDSIILDFENDPTQDDDGWLGKFNTSYYFTDDIMGYLTVSQGYRIGGSNGVPLCPDPIPPGQGACALPNERTYEPDETTNYEIGVRSTWLDGRMTFNGAVYYIDWEKPQLAAATENALIPITVNGKGAETSGIETSINWWMTDRLSVRANYSYTKAELTDLAEDLIPEINPPGFQSTITYVDGEDGDRLPGSPEHQFSLFATYSMPLQADWLLDFHYGIYAISDVLTRTGKKGGGEDLDGYAINNASIVLSRTNWSATLYANNFLDEYAETAARTTTRNIQPVLDFNGGVHNVRSYYKNVLPPRMIGLRVTWQLAQ
jgi:outer membrane receptor protein involved in Fe transport